MKTIIKIKMKPNKPLKSREQKLSEIFAQHLKMTLF